MVIVRALTMVIDNALLALPPRPSVTLKVTVEIPAAVGVPEITPVVALSVRPAGSVPLCIDQLYGDTPPPAARLCE